ncbi:MAG TPA: GAF domain-containing protein [Anaerolineaceae bacterium]|nr:GAF domain-containing protein [Anaerolineaceae bacterium]
MADGIGLGIGFILVGTAFLVAVRLLMRVAPRIQPANIAPVPNRLAASPGEQTDGVLIIEPGGRIAEISPVTRAMFNLPEEEAPNLERLVRKVRPSEDFLRLCAAEGQARISVDGRLMEATSYLLPMQPQGFILVAIRPTELGGRSPAEGGLAAQTLQTFNELNQAMTSSLDVEQTLLAILKSVEKLLPADYMEINLWEPASQWLAPYRLMGLAGVERGLAKAQERYRAGEGYPGYLLEERIPLLITDVDARKDLRPATDRQAVPIRSYIGVPLEVGREVVGTLELGSLSAEAFQTSDLEMLKLLSGQAAIAVRNAVQFRAEQRRAAELNSLAKIAQAFGSLRDPKDLYGRLVQSIAPVMPVEILGFLIYNESNHSLEGQVPFQGIPAQIIEGEWFQVPVPPGSVAEAILLSQDVLLSENAAEDPQWKELSLVNLARAAGVRDTVLVPLISGGRMLGYLQASNHRVAGESFTKDELHLLMIIANQAAPIIENAALVQQSRQRAQRAEALRRIGSLATSAATLDEILKYSLQELAHLLRADMAAALLLDEKLGGLQLHRLSLSGAPPEAMETLGRVLAEDPQFHFTVTGSQHPLVSGNLEEDKTVLPVYRPLIQAFGIRSAVVAPLVVRDRGIGEIWLGGREENAFDRNDVQVVATASGQLAGVVERSILFEQTDESLRRRVEQLTALTRITRELSTTLDLKYLLQMVYDEAVRTTRADCGSILLMDLEASPEDATVTFSIGDPHPAELYEVEKQAMVGGEPITLVDLGEPGMQPGHAGVQAALLAPIYYKDRPAGLIHLHSYAPNRFDPTVFEILQTLALQASMVLGNALQYQEQLRKGELLNRQVETLAKLFETSQALQIDRPLEQALDAIAGGIQETTPFQVVLISLYQPVSGMLKRVCSAGLSLEAWSELAAHEQPWRGIVQLLKPEYRYNQAYYIPADEQPVIPEEVHSIAVLPSQVEKVVDAWDADDFLLMPIYDSQNEPLGLISLDAPSDGRRPDRPTFETLGIFATQARLAIENHRRLDRLSRQVSRVEAELARIEETTQTGQSSLPLLLRKDLQQTLAIHRLSGQAQRIRDGLEIAEIANRHFSAAQVLGAVAQELISRLEMGVALIAENTPGGPAITQVVGQVPEGAKPEALFGQRNPLRQSLQNGEILLMNGPNAGEAEEWRESPLLKALNARSFVSLPIQVNQRIFAAILAVGEKVLAPFSDVDKQIYAQMTRQVGVVLQNIELLTETRRRLDEVRLLFEFSRQLGSLNPAEIVSRLVESALRVIPAARAGTVALWYEKDKCLVPQVAAGYTDSASMLQIRYPLAEAPAAQLLPVDVFLGGQPRRVDEVQFASDYHLSPVDLMCYRKAIGALLPLSSLLVPIRSGESNLGILVLDNFEELAAFTAEDEALASSLTQQTALALENARLYQASEQRAGQLQALTQVAGTITSSLSSEELIGSLLEQFRTVVPYETGILWLRRGNALSVAAALGFPDNEERLGISVAVEDSQLFSEMTETGQAILVKDIREDPRFPSLLGYERLSWVGIPLIAKGELIGAIALEKNEAGFYTSDHIQAATTFASQAAVALENARLYQDSLRRAAELDERSQRLALLNRLSGELSQTLDPERVLSLIGEELLQALNGSVVSAVIFDEQGGPRVPVEVPRQEGVEYPCELPGAPVFDRLRQTLGIFSAGNIGSEPELEPLRLFFDQRGSCSLLALPLVAGTELHGILFLQASSAYRYSLPEIELARTISNQASIAIQNASLFAETRRLTEDLERRVEERTSELTREHHNTETLLRIITELSASLDMTQVLNRTLGVLNEASGAEQCAILLSRGRDLQVYFRTGAGFDSSDESPAWELEKTIARWVVKNHRPVLSPDLSKDERWLQGTSAEPPFCSLIAVPLILGEEVLGSLHLYHPASGQFVSRQVDLVEAAARQISISINNSELFGLIRDQSERLGAMLREQQMEASRSRAILEAVADGVLVTDPENKITLFNISAQTILGLRAEQVIGQSLEQFTGLFGKASQDWVRTIRIWSQDPVSYQAGETYAEQINLDNGGVVAVHLAPVAWRSQFLGTVSIFRDITAEVKVDRLKSEFVANVSHELRTPMTSIKGYVEIMLMGAAGPLSDQQRHFLEIVRNNTTRLGALVNDLLDVSRIEAGRITLNLQSLRLHELAEDVAAEMQRRSRDDQKPMDIRLEIPQDLPRVNGDLERVRQILANLVINSYNYTPANGWVVVRMQARDNEVQVDVQDNGIGIAPESQGRIFERFYRGEDPLVLATSGTGLGLAIVKNLVDMHHGKIWFESKGIRGEGSLFSFTLPVFPEER